VDDNEFNIYTLDKQVKSLNTIHDTEDFANDGKHAIKKVLEK